MPLLPGGIFREKDQTGAIFAAFGYRNAVQQDEFVRNLGHDAGTVAVAAVGTFGSAVVHVFKHTQPRVDDLVAAVALQVDDKTDAAGVVFVFRRIKPPLRRAVLEVLFHGVRGLAQE